LNASDPVSKGRGPHEPAAVPPCHQRAMPQGSISFDRAKMEHRHPV